MDRAPGQVGNDAAFPESDTLHRHVDGQHGDNGIAMAHIGDTGGGSGALGDKRPGLVGSPIEHRDLVTGFHQIRGHARPHLTKPDEADFHDVTPLVRLCFAACCVKKAYHREKDSLIGAVLYNDVAFHSSISIGEAFRPRR